MCCAMADDLKVYKCPCCGGDISFDTEIQKMKCPYCDTEYEVSSLKEYDRDLQDNSADDLHWETAAGGAWQTGETDGLRVFACDACGGEIFGDENTGATACPYCGSNVIMTGAFSGDLRPDYVIPFKLDKQAALDGLQRHLKGKRFLPAVFKDQNHLEEIKGIYVPFWLFDTDASGMARYRATKVRCWCDSHYNYTETSHYSVYREGDIHFNHVPVDGSSKMADDLMESLEPYDFKDAVDFQTAYLAGFLADKYDVDAKTSEERANARIRVSTEEALASTVHGYSTTVKEAGSIRFSNGTARYALYPVWILTTKWQDQLYTFAMNGQTGRFVGDLPLDKKAYWKWFLGLFGAISAGVFGILTLVSLL